ncbi:MAG: Zn(2+)-responsive transcriptional regulator [Gammaproteobacteria bacterium]|jgi:MerR family Zn(II)-responsive transcriptional regulator of zntA|nr:Zn(2+)-responsive transcriptional regulator [Gammaproteobacteria bacterium]MBT3859296.1 Zn(2+)-responsive transcriptional regulator [Gammaproteobacteria bacterium]MBT3987986.1 Zn(2+)-responsive transcriptional regulator [Gammaproteobacteria bacterium]MBT4255402.1 Zn(2+)-responsive transcriptional regulator [Gammaproteobacteria bacterium]MBT4583075.1 Zn(2+)-responsive transcriptional regulator [Gammaproteobacteria bacterium]
MLKISELAAKTGLTAHTLRFYEKNGLISASNRSPAGYRYYTESDVRRAEFVKTARNIGFSLDDISQLLSIRVDKTSHSCQEVTDITRHKLDEVNEKIKELQSMQQTLNILLDSCCGGPELATQCSIMEALDEGEVRNQRNKHKKLEKQK